jgi:hypothetical protein
MSYYMLNGLGQVDFNAPAVWSDWQAGGASGASAAKLIQAALNQLGYGPLTVDGQFGSGSLAAWGRFANDNNTGDAAWPSQVGILKLGDAVTAGGTPGGGPAVLSHVEDGQIVPGASAGGGATKAGMSGMSVGLVVAGLAAVGALVYFSRKKGGGEHGAPMASHPGMATANRRGRRRHHHHHRYA